MLTKKIKTLLSPSELIDKLMRDPNPIKKAIFNKILGQIIPFNAPHGFTVDEISDDSITIYLPYKKNNLNHVKGIHACALATLGEYCSGLLLLYNVGDNYRLILSQLEAQYFYQGKLDVIGNATVIKSDIDNIVNELKSGAESVYKKMTTVITDKQGNKIAEVTANWQIKNWKKVKLKV